MKKKSKFVVYDKNKIEFKKDKYVARRLSKRLDSLTLAEKIAERLRINGFPGAVVCEFES